jgi:hypothetical protein
VGLSIVGCILTELNFDSNNRAVVNILKDAEKNILYEHISRALKAVDEEDPVTIIIELYHVIEKNTPIHLKKIFAPAKCFSEIKI